MIQYLTRHYDDLLRALAEHLQILAVTLVFSLLIAAVLIILAVYFRRFGEALIQPISSAREFYGGDLRRRFRIDRGGARDRDEYVSDSCESTDPAGKKGIVYRHRTFRRVDDRDRNDRCDDQCGRIGNLIV